MRLLLIILMGLNLVLLTCQEKPFRQIPVENPVVRKNTVFESGENLSLPKFQALKAKYQPDTIFHGERNEFKRILLLRDWIKRIIKIDNSGEGYPGKGQAEAILDAALEGNGFHCGHYMIVQNALLNAYGYVTRCMAAGEGDLDALEGHHGVNEVWVNSLNKWVMIDAKYNNHFEKDGLPLSALEIRDEWLKNKGADIQLVKGPDRTPIEYDEDVNNRSKEEFVRIYTWLEWETYNDRYSAWPDVKSHMNHLADEYSRDHVWLWGGKPHWAYGTDYMVLVKDRDAIEWTPNTLSSRVEIEGSTARIFLDAETTPNLKTCQIRRQPSSTWEDVSEALELGLSSGRNELEFRVLNTAGAAGPVHKIIIEN